MLKLRALHCRSGRIFNTGQQPAQREPRQCACLIDERLQRRGRYAAFACLAAHVDLYADIERRQPSVDACLRRCG